MFKTADEQYNNLINQILVNGIWDKDQIVRPKWKDGSPAYTKSVLFQNLSFDNSILPILTTKEVKWKTAIKEILWIWQSKSNVVEDLRKLGVKIWDEWELQDGTIGKAYGYQLKKECISLNNKKVDQVNYLLHNLKHNPSSRRHITTLWSIEDLNQMSLCPCVWKTQWIVKEGKLHLCVEARSSDVGLGLPFNIFQYNILQRMIAQVLNYELGSFVFNIGDAHIYERHIEPLRAQTTLNHYTAPQLIINKEIKNFYDFKIEDFTLINYNHHPFIKLEIAV